MALYDVCDDSIYEVANEIFDEQVFDHDAYLEKYNSYEGGELRDELNEIVGEMIEEAVEAMVECARRRKGDFIDLIESKERDFVMATVWDYRTGEFTEKKLERSDNKCELRWCGKKRTRVVYTDKDGFRYIKFGNMDCDKPEAFVSIVFFC